MKTAVECPVCGQNKPEEGCFGLRLNFVHADRVLAENTAEAQRERSKKCIAQPVTK